jgi:hypothetical protein
MFLILCEPDDHPALWAFQALAARGLAPLEVVTPQALVYGLRWEHRLGRAGARLSIRLHDGRVIDSTRTRGLLNRVAWLSPALFMGTTSADRMYVLGEMTALFMSWLSAMPAPVLNRPSAQGLCGAWRHPSEWVMLAARAGLPTRPYHQDGHHPPEMAWSAGAWSSPSPSQSRDGDKRESIATAFVVASGEGSRSRVIAPDLPAEFAEPCAALARLAGQHLLGITFTRGVDGEWRFLDANPRPDLRRGGAALIEALFDALAEPLTPDRTEVSDEVESPDETGAALCEATS